MLHGHRGARSTRASVTDPAVTGDAMVRMGLPTPVIPVILPQMTEVEGGEDAEAMIMVEVVSQVEVVTNLLVRTIAFLISSHFRLSLALQP